MKGFLLVLNWGSKWAVIIGILLGLQARFGDEDEDLRKAYTDAQKELQINKVLSKSIFDPNFDLHEKHPVITKWTEVANVYCEKYHVASI